MGRGHRRTLQPPVTRNGNTSVPLTTGTPDHVTGTVEVAIAAGIPTGRCQVNPAAKIGVASQLASTVHGTDSDHTGTSRPIGQSSRSSVTCRGHVTHYFADRLG